MLTREQIDQLAIKIAADLMTAGDGSKAERLALIVKGKDWAGWSSGALLDRIVGITRGYVADLAERHANTLR